MRKNPKSPEFFDIKKVAKLASLKLSEGEEIKFAFQFSDILNYLEQLRKLDTKNVDETSQVTGLENVTRKDEADSSRTLSQDEALSNSKSKHNGFLKIKGIFNEE